MKRLLFALAIVAVFVIGVFAGQDMKALESKARFNLFRSAGYNNDRSTTYAMLPWDNMAQVFDFTTKEIKRGSHLIIQDYEHGTIGIVTFDEGVSYTQLIPKPKETGK